MLFELTCANSVIRVTLFAISSAPAFVHVLPTALHMRVEITPTMARKKQIQLYSPLSTVMDAAIDGRKVFVGFYLFGHWPSDPSAS